MLPWGASNAAAVPADEDEAIVGDAEGV